VPDRDGILFHPGNTIDDTEGCIILGIAFGKLGPQRAILNSGQTFKTFMYIMKDVDEFKFTVKEVW
jgi:hypothetical protein